MSMLVFLYMVSLVLALWMVVRIWRGSALLAICSLLLPGVILIALVKNWGDPDTDIKLPFLLSVVVSVMLYFSLMNVAEQEFGLNPEGSVAYEDASLDPGGFDLAKIAAQFTDGELEQLRQRAAEFTDEERVQLRQDAPELAAMLAAAEQSRSGDDLTSERWGSATPQPSTENDEDALDPEEQKRLDERAAASVMRQSGPIEIGPAYASLRTPSHFRFVSKPRLQGAARLHERKLSKDVVGWVVHERVNLAEDLAWFAEIRFRPVGHLQASGVRGSEELQQAVAALGGEVSMDGMFAPSWSPSRAMITWTRSVPGSSAVEAVAALPLRHGVLSYVVRVPVAKERQLALRTARLLATETEIDDGWRYADAPANTPAKGPTFAQWVSGAAGAGEALAEGD